MKNEPSRRKSKLGARRAYRAPKLVRFGAVAQLTAGGSGGGMDMGTMGMTDMMMGGGMMGGGMMGGMM